MAGQFAWVDVSVVAVIVWVEGLAGWLEVLEVVWSRAALFCCCVGEFVSFFAFVWDQVEAV